MTRPRRHPAQASRIAAAGLSAATMLTMVAVLGARAGPDTERAVAGQVASVPAPSGVAVTRRQPTPAVPPVRSRPSRTTRRPRRPPAKAPDTTTGPS